MRGFTLVLADEELGESQLVMSRDDAGGAFEWLKVRLKGTARDLLEGGRKVMISEPGSGATGLKGSFIPR